jgi:Na+/pantothenate symporter
MNSVSLAWGAIALYVIVTIALTIRGALKTKDLKSYAVGNKDIPPVLVGISLVAQLTSVATFVVNPGLIYEYGLSALLGFGIAAALGITTGLFIFSKRFLNVGSKISAITVPQWIGKRYESQFLQGLFAFISLALITFGVLIVVAMSYSLGMLLQISPFVAGAINPGFIMLISALVIFVFAYMMIGGAATHAYTNSIQGIIMLIVALILIISGLPLLWKDGGIIARLTSIDPNLMSVVNVKSLYFRNLFEVFFCNFLVGLAIVCQPHIVSKVLYLKNDRQIKPYLITAMIAGLVFSLVMITGFYAKITNPGIERMDLAVPTYIATNFSPILQIIITLGIICAGLSTLEGILLSLSTIFSTDIFLPIFSRKSNDSQKNMRRSMNYGRVLLVFVAMVIIYLSIWQVKNPTGGSVAIFGMYGVYLLFTTAFFPLACGMFLPSVKKAAIIYGVLSSIIIYLSVAYFKITFMHNNPAFLATCAIIGGWIVIMTHRQLSVKE